VEFKTDLRTNLPPVPVLETNILAMPGFSDTPDQIKSEIKIYGRLAAPWTCVVVVLIAIPFGAVSGRRNAFVGVAASIVICFIYFVLQQLALALGTGGYLQPWLAGWLPNLSFALVGLLLTARIR
jgi:lipopolysaccharide export system permease protein